MHILPYKKPLNPILEIKGITSLDNLKDQDKINSEFILQKVLSLVESIQTLFEKKLPMSTRKDMPLVEVTKPLNQGHNLEDITVTSQISSFIQPFIKILLTHIIAYFSIIVSAILFFFFFIVLWTISSWYHKVRDYFPNSRVENLNLELNKSKLEVDTLENQMSDLQGDINQMIALGKKSQQECLKLVRECGELRNINANLRNQSLIRLRHQQIGQLLIAKISGLVTLEDDAKFLRVLKRNGVRVVVTNMSNFLVLTKR